MQIKTHETVSSADLIAVFEGSFSDAEGPEEGQTIARLVEDLIRTTDTKELIGYCAGLDDRVVGAVFFSRLRVASDYNAWMLSPMAVATAYQKQGIGQQLIRYGLEQLRLRGVPLVLTYGDPAFYGKLGFKPINVQQIAAPYPLSQPLGWQAVSLSPSPIPVIAGSTQCVPAFCNRAYW